MPTASETPWNLLERLDRRGSVASNLSAAQPSLHIVWLLYAFPHSFPLTLSRTSMVLNLPDALSQDCFSRFPVTLASGLAEPTQV